MLESCKQTPTSQYKYRNDSEDSDPIHRHRHIIVHLYSVESTGSISIARHGSAEVNRGKKARYLLVAMEWVGSNTSCLYRTNQTERNKADSIVAF
jgi:hypothetical protein